MIAEALVISPEIERAVIAGSDSSKIEAIARDQGMRTMFEHGLEKARSGQTTLHEILRVTRER
jgi:general secretion pathway protein E